ncbi:MAG TPA: hypothetical protein VJ939_00615 [Bacteroidales bacterium]|nr:hypothetical protein [Bacteroidales bacterium]
MIKYLKHEEIDTEKWDLCVRKSFNSLIYGYSWYLDVVAGEWDGLVEDDYERVMPVTHRKKAGIAYLFQPFFTQQLGIYSKGKLNSEKVGEFLAELPASYKLVEINLNTFNQAPENLKKHFRPMRNYELDLISSHDEIRQSYAKNLRRNIRKAEKAKVQMMQNIRPEEVIRIFRENRGKYIKQLNDEAYRMLKQLVYVLIYRGRAKVWGAFDESNTLLAGAIFIRSKNRWIFLFSGATELAKETGAMPFLIDRFIMNHASSNNTLDFEGSNDDNLARFYQSFGAKKGIYYQFRKNTLPFWINGPVQTIKKLKNL